MNRKITKDRKVTRENIDQEIGWCTKQPMDRETQYYERRLASIILEVGTDGDILLTDKETDVENE